MKLVAHGGVSRTRRGLWGGRGPLQPLVVCATLAFAQCQSASEPARIDPTLLRIAALAESDKQLGFVNTTLPRPLRVRVEHDGIPVSRVRVRWTTTFGTVQPTDVVTDSLGIAEVRWTMGAIGDVAATSPSAVASLAESPQRSATFTATVTDALTLSLLPGSSGQRATVGTTLGTPLRVRVEDHGAPRAGVTVYWDGIAPQGAISRVTDANGVASVPWTLPTAAYTYRAYVWADVNPRNVVTIDAVGLPDVVDSIGIVSGNNQSIPTNGGAYSVLVATAFDRYRNPIGGAKVQWRVDSGPALLRAADSVTNGAGMTYATVAPNGATGTAIVSVAASTRRSEFRLTARAAEWNIMLNSSTLQFISLQNGSSPAVDTVPVGSVAIWTIQPFDYDNHSVSFFNSPIDPGTDDFPYNKPITVTFTVPGVYHYRDRYNDISGTIVVTPR